MQVPPQGLPVRGVSVVPLLDARPLGVVVLLVLVHPHLSQATVVACQDLIYSTRERVGLPLSEDVAHTTAGNDLQLSPTHPDLRQWGKGRTQDAHSSKELRF